MYEKALRKKGMPVSESVGAAISPEELADRPEPKVVDTTALPSEHLRPVVSTTLDRKSTRLNSSHSQISYAVFCLKKKKPNYMLLISRKQGGSDAARLRIG